MTLNDLKWLKIDPIHKTDGQTDGRTYLLAMVSPHKEHLTMKKFSRAFVFSGVSALSRLLIFNFLYIMRKLSLPWYLENERTRPDTRLSQLRAGRQGSKLRSLYYLGRSSEAKNRKKVKCDGRTDGQTDGPTDRPTKRGVESCSTRLKKERKRMDLIKWWPTDRSTKKWFIE